MSDKGTKAAKPALLRFVKSNQFKRQLQKINSIPKHKTSVHNVWELLEILRSEKQIPEYFQNHPLSGKFSGWNDAHMAPDLILLWQKTVANGESVIVLGALGTHSELGLA